MRLGFRAKTFLSLMAVASAAVVVGAALLALSLRTQLDQQIERSLVSQTRLTAQMLAERAPGTGDLADEADRLGHQTGARVTLIAADGTVVGDSEVSRADLANLENHGTRPEVIAARHGGLGTERRYSRTLSRNMLYVAVPVQGSAVAIVRLSLPLTSVAHQLAAVWNATLWALAVALVSAAALSWLSSRLLGRRVRAIASSARAYASGDFAHPARDQAPDELGTVAQVLDDTVRQLAVRMAETAEDRARLEAILSGMLEGVLVVDGKGRVQMVNRAAREMLGLDTDAAGRHYVESIRHPGIAAILGQALKGLASERLEFQPARSSSILVARAAPVSAPSTSGAVLVLHDVTEIRRADQVRRDFVANVSHELRTPLTAIRGYVEALSDEPLEPLEREQFLEVIARQTGRMEHLVRDLLRLASLDAREEPIEAFPCKLGEIVHVVLRDLSLSLEAKRQQVRVTVAPEVETIAVDAAKLQDALRNIVENASNYAPADSRIDVSACRDDDRVVMRVEDEGPGIPEMDLERIFERFYRVDKARSRESGGTGLGLSIVKHLVQRLGGDVRAGNRPGGGAVFTIRLPFQSAAPPDG